MTRAANNTQPRPDLIEEAAKGRAVTMMAGMYAAISGLDANQAMLNETANDLANVNTVGYKAASITFADSLTQVIRGASGPTPHQRRHQPGADRARRAGQRDDQRNVRGLLPVDEQPARRRDRGRGLPARRPRRRHAEELTKNMPGERRLHARRRPHDQHAGLPDDAVAANTWSAATPVTAETETGDTYEAGQRRHLHQDPARLHQHLDRPGRLGQLHRREQRIENLPAAGDRRLPVAGDVPQRKRPRTPGRVAVGADRQLRARRSSARPTRPASARRSAASSRCRTSTSRPR